MLSLYLQGQLRLRATGKEGGEACLAPRCPAATLPQHSLNLESPSTDLPQTETPGLDTGLCSPLLLSGAH